MTMRSTLLAVAVAAATLSASCQPQPDAVLPASEGALLPLDHPALGEARARDPRRLSHLQLRRSVDALMGTRWTEDGIDLLYVLAPTLSDPDYDEITEENLDPSPLYVKFMEDLSNAVCEAAPMSRLMLGPTLEESVSRLKLTLHGEYLPAGDPGLEPLVELGRRTDLRKVCVALLGAPEFYLY